jgi:hypothetical protein
MADATLAKRGFLLEDVGLRTDHGEKIDDTKGRFFTP